MMRPGGERERERQIEGNGVMWETDKTGGKGKDVCVCAANIRHGQRTRRETARCNWRHAGWLTKTRARTSC